MSLKHYMLLVGCLVAWLVLMPIVLIGGVLALFLYAVVAEFGQMLSGASDMRLDPSATREMMLRICAGYNPWRLVSRAHG